MDPIDTLMQEHRIIEEALDALEGWVDHVVDAGSDDRQRLGQFTDFIQSFADRWHHGKEEDILFAAMIDNGFPKDAGPIAVMLHEHDLGRGLVQKMVALAEHPEPWSVADRQTLNETAYEFSQLLRDHIQKEDEVLYPMARARLPAEVMEAMIGRFQKVDDDAAEKDRLTALAGALLDRTVRLPG